MLWRGCEEVPQYVVFLKQSRLYFSVDSPVPSRNEIAAEFNIVSSSTGELGRSASHALAASISEYPIFKLA
jgi:hypothetical protein